MAAGEGQISRRLIYGDLGGDLVFVDEERIPEFRAYRDALTVQTWGEFKVALDAIEPGIYDEVTQYYDDDFDPSEDFDGAVFLDLRDYDWPPGLLSQSALATLPESVRERFLQPPRLSDSPASGDLPSYYRPEDEKAILTALAAAGIAVRRDDMGVRYVFL